MQVRRGGIESGLYAQRNVGRPGFFKFGAKPGLANNLSGSLFDVGKLFVNGGEWHRQIIPTEFAFTDWRTYGLTNLNQYLWQLAEIARRLQATRWLRLEVRQVGDEQ